MNINILGWNETLAQHFNELAQPDWLPARVSAVNRGLFTLLSTAGELSGTITGKLRNQNSFPVVGDWVAITVMQTALIHAILPRQTLLSRKSAGNKTAQQILAANIDYLFVITGLDHNFNLRRIERYLTLAWNSGAEPIVVLNKTDILSDDEREQINGELATISLMTKVHFISALTGNGMSELRSYFSPHKTIALVGSSGAGKSTLTNYFLGKKQQKTAATREEDSKGRHTTTSRELFLLPDGGMIIDTPGMRELQLWLDEEELDSSFQDINELAKNCKFADCSHDSEPDCAVKAAIAKGTLDPNRLTNYQKMQRELKHLALKQQETNWQQRKDERKFAKMCREVMKHKQKPTKS